MLRVLSKVLNDTLHCFTGPVARNRDLNCTKYWYPGHVEAIFIEGHTDTDPVKSDSEFRDNWDLSTARAIKTYEFLIKCNPELDLIKNHEGESIFSVSGYEAKRPVAPNDTEQNKMLNRRIDLRFIMTPPSVPPEIIPAVEEKLENGLKS